MTISSAVPSILLAVMKNSAFGVRVVCRAKNLIGIDRCPFEHAHEGHPNVGAMIVMDPDLRQEERLVCAICGTKGAHEVLRLHSFQDVFLAFVGWVLELDRKQSPLNKDEGPVAGA